MFSPHQIKETPRNPRKTDKPSSMDQSMKYTVDPCFGHLVVCQASRGDSSQQGKTAVKEAMQACVLARICGTPSGQ